MKEHPMLAQHLNSRERECVASKVKGSASGRQHHWFDALYNACAAGHGCGVRLVDEQVAQPPPRQRRSPREDETPWIDPAQLVGWMRPRRW